MKTLKTSQKNGLKMDEFKTHQDSISTKDVSLNKPHNCVRVIYGTSYGFYSFGYIIHSKENV